MIYFLLPSTYIYTYKNIICDIIEKNINSQYTTISNSLSLYLYDIKHKINIYGKEWDTYKKYTNPYEFINTNIPQKTMCVAKYKPLSRSYFKMLEIMQHFNLHLQSESIDSIKSFHLAEGPGGFIEAVSNIRNCIDDKYIGMTIIDSVENDNVPGWKKSERFFKKYTNASIELGEDKTGNIISLTNFVYCKNKYKSSMDLITADGGFDFSFDYNSQETNIVKLLFAQIAFALCMQKKGGNFILKIFDCFMQQTIDLLYILTSFYENVYITKPQTSRYANSEKYIICKGFLFSSCDDFYPYLYSVFEKMVNITDNDLSFRFLKNTIPCYFINKLEELNAIFGQQQIENIHNTILLINNKNKINKIENLIKINIQKSIQWCIKHNIKYNIFSPNNSCVRETTVS